MEKLKNFIFNTKYFAQGALRFDLGKIFYTDPYKIDKCYKDADYIFISHPHHDHLSREDIDKVIQKNATIIAPFSIKKDIENLGYENPKIYCHFGEMYLIEDFSFTIQPAYNNIKTTCHNKKNHWCGILIEYDGMKIYYTSDTEKTSEMNSLKADILFLPLGQTYTFESVEEAAETVISVGAKYAVPVHYGLYEGTRADAEKLKELLKDKAEVIIKK